MHKSHEHSALGICWAMLRPRNVRHPSRHHPVKQSVRSHGREGKSGSVGKLQDPKDLGHCFQCGINV